MPKLLTRILGLSVITQMLFACAMLQEIMPGSITDQATVQGQRAVSGNRELAELDEIDTLIKLDNGGLAEQITGGLKAQAALSGSFYFRKLDVRFNKQFVALDSELNITDGNGNSISAWATGDVLLDFSGDRLQWFPRFDHLRVSSVDFSFAQQNYAQADEALNQRLLRRLNEEITDVLILHDYNAIPLNATPLGGIEVGASLPGFSQTATNKKQVLNGVFIVAGSAILIEPSVTSIALDLKFIPELSSCPADVLVSRAVFASGVENREPVGVARNMNATEDVSYFYSEISGAKRPLTVIHYWFADGQPLSVQELAVEPSQRWRTWSSKGSSQTGASHFEVLVVEKESGCILHSESIRKLEDEAVLPGMDKAGANTAFETLNREFKTRTSGFSISEETPEIALVEVRRVFLRDVLQASLTDMDIEAVFDPDRFVQQQYSAPMRPFETAEIECSHGNCMPSPACTVSLTHCKRSRDTRDCSSCLFRNPLNNRCVSQAVDPICEAARSRQNAKYEADRAMCIARAEEEKQECEQLNAQALRSCEIESGFEQSACETVKSGIASLQKGSPLATVRTEVIFDGQLSAAFSNISIVGDFTRLEMDLTLKSDLKLTGDLQFQPGKIPEPLADCVTAWSVPFNSRAVTSAVVNRMLTRLSEGENSFTANWSGSVIPIETTPSPLESVFVGNSSLLANCSIGLTVNDVEQAFMGDDAGFFGGRLKLEIQPSPARIRLSAATLKYGERIYQGDANISTDHVRYDIAR